MRLSVAMATLNAGRFLAEALASVRHGATTCGIGCEILVADGGSRDDTLAIAEATPDTRVVSRADGGIYDGMNQALAAASGELVMIVNSDDLLVAENLSPALRQLAGAPDHGFLSGDMLFGPSREGAALRLNTRPLSVEGAFCGIPAINARIFRRDFLRRIGPLRTDLGLASDRDFLARVARSGARGVHFGAPLYFYRVHTGSSTIAGDLGARHRIYRADMQLAAAYEADPGRDPEFMQITRANAAVSAVKARITRASATPRPVTGPGDLLRGLALLRRWRGRMAGY
jgi:glycosyltransferase involved in cell wall biosynthesis